MDNPSFVWRHMGQFWYNLVFVPILRHNSINFMIINCSSYLIITLSIEIKLMKNNFPFEPCVCVLTNNMNGLFLNCVLIGLNYWLWVYIYYIYYQSSSFSWAWLPPHGPRIHDVNRLRLYHVSYIKQRWY